MEFTIEFITVVRNERIALAKTITNMDRVFDSLENCLSISHLIIDGDSSDDSVEYVNNLVEVRKIPTRIISEPDSGIYDAMNKGVRNSHGKTLVFLNAGDILCEQINVKNLITDAITMLDKEQVAVTAYSALLSFPRKNIRIKSRCVSKSEPRMPSIHQSLLYKREFLLTNLYDTSFKVCGDYDQFCRMYSAGAEVVVADMTLANFFSGGVSTQKPLVLYSESVSISDKYFKLSPVRKYSLRIKLIASLIVFRLLHRLYS
jgi:putative colanic acid biosynthesis glycosyltransferase